MEKTALVRSLAILPAAALLLTLAPWSAATAGDAQQSAPARPAEAKPAEASPGEYLEAKHEDIRRLLEANGVRGVTASMLEPMMKGFEQMPGMTPEIIDAVKAEFMASLDDLIDASIKPYSDHLSHEDIKAALAFAESPAGQRLAAAQPKIVAETTALGMKWGQSLQPRIMKRVDDMRRAKAEGTN